MEVMLSSDVSHFVKILLEQNKKKTVMDCLEFDSVHSQVLEGCLQKKKHILTNCDAK